MRRACTVAVLVGAVASLVLPMVGGGTAGANVTDLSGSGAFGIQAAVSGTAAITVGPTPTVVLPAGGGNQSASLTTVNVPTLLTTGALTVHTQGSNVGSPQGTAQSSASVASLSLLLDAPGGGVAAGVLQSSCTSTGGGSVGTANVANLNVFGTAITVSGTPNQTVTVPVGKLGTVTAIINEQTVTNTPGVETKITVNALHVKLNVVFTTPGDVNDVIVSQSRCRAAGPDVLGGTPATTTTTTQAGNQAGNPAANQAPAAAVVTAGPRFTG